MKVPKSVNKTGTEELCELFSLAIAETGSLIPVGFRIFQI